MALFRLQGRYEPFSYPPGTVCEYQPRMAADTRPDDPENDERPADGPLTHLVDKHTAPPQQPPLASELPRPPEAKPTGREDYARGTAEHDDDRET